MSRRDSIDVRCKGGVVTVRPLEAADRAALQALARDFPTHDLLFLRRDLTRPEEIERWIEDQAAGRLHTLVALRDAALLAVAVILPARRCGRRMSANCWCWCGRLRAARAWGGN
jgi:hypothetical protein